MDIKIHILDFISAPSKSPPAQELRDTLERKWIHRLQTLAPHGLNSAEHRRHKDPAGHLFRLILHSQTTLSSLSDIPVYLL
jgi:hypothetical protein